MGDLDDTDPEAVSLTCRAIGEVLTSYGQTDLAKLSKRQFREMVKAAIATWEAEKGR